MSHSANIADEAIDVDSALAKLGVEPTSTRGDWADALCPLHPEHDPSFSYHTSSGAWICRHEGLRGGLLDLVARLRGCDRGAAARWVRGFAIRRDVGIDEIIERLLGGHRPDEHHELAWAERFYRLSTNVMTEWWFERGFTEETMRRFDVRLDEEEGCIIWPVRNEDANTVSFIKRRLPGVGGTKYLYPRGFRRTLFPLDHFIGSDAVLVEGPLDAMWLYQLGYSSGLALLGTDMSAAQRAWLLSNARRVTLMLDGDDAGQRATRILIGRLAGVDVRVVALLDGRDVQDLSPEEVKNALEKTMPVLKNVVQ